MGKMNKLDSSVPVEMTLQEYADSHGISYSSALYRKRRAKIEAGIVIVDERVKYKEKYKIARKLNDGALSGEMTLSEYAEACSITKSAARLRKRNHRINPNVTIVRKVVKYQGKADDHSLYGEMTLQEYADACHIPLAEAAYKKGHNQINPNVIIVKDESEKRGIDFSAISGEMTLKEYGRRAWYPL